MRDDDKTTVHAVPPLADGAVAACLVVLGSANQLLVGRVISLTGAALVIGRDTEAGLSIVDDGVSRRHAQLEPEPDGGWRLLDLGSTNGTFVNGRAIRSVRLVDGDRVQIGRTTVLKYGVQDQLEEAYQRALYERATRDGLTGVYNKKFLLDALSPAIAASLRHGTALGLVLLDIDHFKRINDSYGHPAGDLVLREVAAALSRVVRAEDLLARYGGEEFAVLLRDADPAAAFACAERCRREIEALLFDPTGLRIRVTVSAGVATLPDPALRGAELLIAAADAALYQAKRLGRNRTEQQCAAHHEHPAP